jgi:hypothetical protein
MHNRLLDVLFFAALMISCGPLGCTQSGSQPPDPLAVEQIPAEMNKAFAKAPAEIKETVEKLNGSLEAKDYIIAAQTVQTLFNLPVATKDQRMISTRAMLTINGLLQTAQAQGDQKAAAALAEQRRLK